MFPDRPVPACRDVGRRVILDDHGFAFDGVAWTQRRALDDARSIRAGVIPLRVVGVPDWRQGVGGAAHAGAEGHQFHGARRVAMGEALFVSGVEGLRNGGWRCEQRTQNPFAEPISESHS